MQPRSFAARLRHLLRCRGEYKLLERQRQTISEGLAAPVPAKFSAQHLSFLRNLRVTWLPVESGAPGLRPFLPFGANRSTRPLGFELIGRRDEVMLAKLLVETGQLIPAFCMHADLAVGTYAVPADMHDYFADPQTGVSPDGTFDFREEHAALLRQSNWRMDMLDPPCWPLPSVDGKRPYGDCSYFQIDMASHLGKPYSVSSGGEVQTDEVRDAEFDNLHRQMLAALQVLLVHATISERAPFSQGQVRQEMQ